MDIYPYLSSNGGPRLHLTVHLQAQTALLLQPLQYSEVEPISYASNYLFVMFIPSECCQPATIHFDAYYFGIGKEDLGFKDSDIWDRKLDTDWWCS